jgi:predicted ATPase
MSQDDHVGAGLLREIHPVNLLSFGPETKPLGLRSLNLLVGPNASGKSNLIEAVALMRATPEDVRAVLRRGGGPAEWIWKGQSSRSAHVELVVRYPQGTLPLRHILAFQAEYGGLRIEQERIENEMPHEGESKASLYYELQNGRALINTAGKKRELKPKFLDRERSILAQRRDPERYPELTYLAETYAKIRIYRESAFGRNTVFREPQRADMRNDRLEEDFSNLGLLLNRLRRKPKAKAAILEGLRDLYDGVSDFDVIVEGGTVQVFFTEGEFTIPATRLSDGTLRYLCLLAILCDPEPPPLICIEEPELGLHPDILPKLADLLVAASERTQLIVTTHSDILVDAMTDRPEAVIVCEKHEGATEMRRLNQEDLARWLENYRLGQLWTRGQIGGTRW